MQAAHNNTNERCPPIQSMSSTTNTSALPEIDNLVQIKIREERQKDVKVVVEELETLRTKLDTLQLKYDSLELQIEDVDKKIDILHVQTGQQLEKLEKRMQENMDNLTSQMETGFKAIMLQLAELHNNHN